MRISDWSSDVCSSDLEAIAQETVGDVEQSAHGSRRVVTGGLAKKLVGVFGDDEPPTIGLTPGGGEGRRHRISAGGRKERGKVVRVLEQPVCVADVYRIAPARPEIGRASWRERVCQYV